jgi:hypothetical protein
MSFLYPALLMATAAVGLPILLHLIRRRVRDRVTFSSLRFVQSTLPRLRNRRRLENLALLVLRGLAVCLLALAFARPFMAAPAASPPPQPIRRTVVLVDTSGSMRRPGLWSQAVNEARSALGGSGPLDRVCLMTFDQEARFLVGFDAWAAMDPDQRVPAAARQLAELSPGWQATNLGRALVSAAEAIGDDDAAADSRDTAVRQIVLISDLQRGSRLEALAAFEWPREVQVVLKQVRSQATTNAAMQRVAAGDSVAVGLQDEQPLVRVTNSSDAKAEQFRLAWAGQDEANRASTAVDVYVAPGASVVVRAPARQAGSAADRLVLTGDDQDFDNTLYVAPAVRAEVNILYLGPDDPNDPKAQLFYLRQAFDAVGRGAAMQGEPNSAKAAGASPCRVVWRSSAQDLSAAELDASRCVVIGDTLSPGAVAGIRKAFDSGLTCLVAMKSGDMAATVAGLAGLGDLRCAEAEGQAAEGRAYAMLSRIEFGHPLLAPFSDARFGDFTRIHFWRHRRIDLAGLRQARVLAWFDGNEPALVEIPAAKGTLLVLATGWDPGDSDLALSSKFVPLLYSVLEYGGVVTTLPLQYSVADAVPIAARQGASPGSVRRPDGQAIPLEPGQETFAATDLPGIYTLESPGQPARSFAVNLAAQESRTEPMAIEDLEGLGVVLKASPGGSPAAGRAITAQAAASQAEQRQKLWRWLLVAAMAILLTETWLAARTSAAAGAISGGEGGRT